MNSLNLKQFKYTHLLHPDDVTSMPLQGNLFGLNNKIYANLGSYNLEIKAENKAYFDQFSENDLRFACLNRLFEIHITVREYDAKKEYTTYSNLDFKDVYELVKKNSKKMDDDKISIYASYNDSGNKTDKELGVLLIPLGSKVLLQAANYAYQQIEKLKMDNFMNNLDDSVHVKRFLNIF